MKLPEIIEKSFLFICLAIILLVTISMTNLYDEIGDFLVGFVNNTVLKGNI